MPIEVDTVTGPAFLAGALVNGDETGLEDRELPILEAFVKSLGDWYVVSVADDDWGNPQEPRFTWQYALYGGDCSGGDVLDYVVHRIQKEG